MTSTWIYRAIDNSAQQIAEPKILPDAGCAITGYVNWSDQVTFCFADCCAPILKKIAIVPEAYDGQVASTAVMCHSLLCTVGISGVPILLHAYRDVLEMICGTATRHELPSGKQSTDVRDQPIPLAPLPEQHRIVAEIETQFTRLDAGVAALKRAQANLRRYKATVLKAACEGRLVPTEAELARARGPRLRTGGRAAPAHPGRAPRQVGGGATPAKKYKEARAAGHVGPAGVAGGVGVDNVGASDLDSSTGPSAKTGRRSEVHGGRQLPGSVGY